MKKIKELTPAQVAKFPIYIAEWVKRGLTTKRMEETSAMRDYTSFQTLILKKKETELTPVVIFDSPLRCWIAVVLCSVLPETVKGKTSEQLQKSLESDIEDVMAGKPRIDKSNFDNFIYPYFDGQFWANWFSFYEFMKNELGVVYENIDAYNCLKECQKYGMVFPLNNICVVCQPPTRILKNASGLHCENGPALSYNGDNEIYALNGVVMKKEYILTPAEKIETVDVLKETNVEIRRELFRKIGIDRLLDDLPHTLLDKRDNYELYKLQLSEEIKEARYLKMTNPSIGCYHVEAVGPECNTVEEAINWRAGSLLSPGESWNPDILT
jgi:hypothetical protein